MPLVIVAVVVAYVVTARLTPPPARRGARPATAGEVADDHADDRHEVELADEHLDDGERVADRRGGREVAEARRGEHGEAVVDAVALGRRRRPGRSTAASPTFATKLTTHVKIRPVRT